MMRSFLLTLLLVSADAALAQTQTPYAGMESRAVKALSEQQIADLRAGRGMGLALAAELNGYPGPVHVLELAEGLGLTAEQKARVQSLFEAMKAETIPLGERLIAQEAALDELFATRRVSQTSLRASTAEIGETQAALRYAHLAYHLSTVAVLSEAQIARYAELRGYGTSPTRGHDQKKHH